MENEWIPIEWLPISKVIIRKSKAGLESTEDFGKTWRKSTKEEMEEANFGRKIILSEGTINEIIELINEASFSFYHGDGGYVSGRLDGVLEVAELLFDYKELEEIKKKAEKRA